MDAQIRQAAGGAFVLNARTDAFQFPGDDALAVAIWRGNRFLAAGADCVFVPGVTDVPRVGRAGVGRRRCTGQKPRQLTRAL